VWSHQGNQGFLNTTGVTKSPRAAAHTILPRARKIGKMNEQIVIAAVFQMPRSMGRGLKLKLLLGPN